MAVREMWNDPTHPGIYDIPGVGNWMVDSKYQFNIGDNARGRAGLQTRPGAVAGISQRTFLLDQSGMPGMDCDADTGCCRKCHVRTHAELSWMLSRCPNCAMWQEWWLLPVAGMVAMHPRPWSTSSEESSRKCWLCIPKCPKVHWGQTRTRCTSDIWHCMPVLCPSAWPDQKPASIWPWHWYSHQLFSCPCTQRSVFILICQLIYTWCCYCCRQDSGISVVITQCHLPNGTYSDTPAQGRNVGWSCKWFKL